MRVGIFGGTFDPIHAGHIAPVEAALRTLDLERVYYLPTANPPHKSGRRFAPAHARYAMVELALVEHSQLWVSPFEMSTEAAYTVTTLEHFRSELPNARLVLLLGADAFAALPTWRRWREIPGLAQLAVLAREGWDPGAPAEPDLEELLSSGRAVAVANRPIEVSATELRERLAQGLPVPEDWVPALVLQYMRKYALYR